MSKLKSAAHAVVSVLTSPTLRPAEVQIIRAVVAAVIAAAGVKLGFTVK